MRSCINWPAILDIGESGDWTEFPFFRLPFRGYVLSGVRNSRVFFCSFGRISDQFGARSWAAHQTGMVANLLSCEIDMTEWLKEK